VVRVVPLLASAIRNSTPSGVWTRARCSTPVTGLRIGSPSVSISPGTEYDRAEL